jgi:hypothetical protein
VLFRSREFTFSRKLWLRKTQSENLYFVEVSHSSNDEPWIPSGSLDLVRSKDTTIAIGSL